MQSAAIKGLRR